MAKLRSVASLLAAQPHEDLIELRETLLSEAARVQTELALVEEALNRKIPPKSTRSSKKARRESGRLPRSELFKIIAAQGKPVSAPEVRSVLEDQGMTLRTEAVRTSMSRLVEDGKLVRLGEGLYAVASNGSQRNGADTPLSRVGQRQSQET